MGDRDETGLPGGAGARRRPSPRDARDRGADAEAEQAATEWQIVLELRQLLAHQPSLVLELLEGLGAAQHSIAPQLLAAAREALAAHPRDAEIHERAAAVLARLGMASAAYEIRTRSGRLAGRDGASASPCWAGLAPGRSPPRGSA